MPWGSGVVDQILNNTRSAPTNDAQFAVLMMNVPDASNPRNVAIVEQRVNQFIAKGIVPILSTIPPRTDPTFDRTLAVFYNDEIRSLAERLKVPLIDYDREILLRRPGTSWANTILSGDGVHPSGGANGYTPSSDPYANGGNAATHTTGDAL